jgi:hypothetical protein
VQTYQTTAAPTGVTWLTQFVIATPGVAANPQPFTPLASANEYLRDTTNVQLNIDYEMFAQMVPDWMDDACEWYIIYDASVVPCLSQSVLLEEAIVPKALKDKDFAWANAVLIALDLAGIALTVVLTSAVVMMTCGDNMMKKMQSSGSVEMGRMGMDDRDASQMDLNAPSNNDISADVGFNTTPAPSALISNKSTPGANVSVEPATQ